MSQSSAAELSMQSRPSSPFFVVHNKISTTLSSARLQRDRLRGVQELALGPKTDAGFVQGEMITGSDFASFLQSLMETSIQQNGSRHCSIEAVFQDYVWKHY